MQDSPAFIRCELSARQVLIGWVDQCSVSLLPTRWVGHNTGGAVNLDGVECI